MQCSLARRCDAKCLGPDVLPGEQRSEPKGFLLQKEDCWKQK